SRAGVASRPSRAPRDAPAARRPLRVEPARTRHRRLAGGALRRLARSRDVATLRDGGGLRRARPLLPPAGTAARPATVARDRRAEGLSHGTEAGSPAARGASSTRTTHSARERIGPLTVDNHHPGNVIRAAKEAECHDRPAPKPHPEARSRSPGRARHPDASPDSPR